MCGRQGVCVSFGRVVRLFSEEHSRGYHRGAHRVGMVFVTQRSSAGNDPAVEGVTQGTKLLYGLRAVAVIRSA